VIAARLGGALAAAILLVQPAGVRAGAARDVLALPVRHGTDAAVPLGNLLGGTPALVAFWTTYCPPCRAEVPALRRAASRWRAHGVRVVGIALDVRDAAELTRVAREWEIDYETYWVPPEAHAAAAALAPEGLPVAFFVGRADVVRHDRLLDDTAIDTLLPRYLDVPPAAGR
jgi:thiol-disulfide isomerase/thioredoxin